jgi:hypothetical protein
MASFKYCSTPINIKAMARISSILCRLADGGPEQLVLWKVRVLVGPLPWLWDPRRENDEYVETLWRCW